MSFLYLLIFTYTIIPQNYKTLGRKRLLSILWEQGSLARLRCLLTKLTHPSTGAKPPQNSPTHFSCLKYPLSRKYQGTPFIRFIVTGLNFTGSIVTRLGPKTQSAPISCVLLKYQTRLSRPCPDLPDIVLLQTSLSVNKIIKLYLS